MRCGDYTELVEGRAPNAADTVEFFTAVPAGFSAADAFLFSINIDAVMVGIAGVLRGWNAPDKAHLGLLLLAPEARGRGVGTVAVAQLESFVGGWQQVTTMRLAVVVTNQNGLVFWRKMGYVETGEVKPKTPPYVADIVVMEKCLAR